MSHPRFWELEPWEKVHIRQLDSPKTLCGAKVGTVTKPLRMVTGRTVKATLPLRFSDAEPKPAGALFPWSRCCADCRQAHERMASND